eukprot:1790102-Rhodomonas_salina.11
MEPAGKTTKRSGCWSTYSSTWCPHDLSQGRMLHRTQRFRAIASFWVTASHTTLDRVHHHQDPHSIRGDGAKHIARVGRYRHSMCQYRTCSLGDS